MCKHERLRETASRFPNKTIESVVKDHKTPGHCNVKKFQSQGKRRWVDHAAYKTIIRQEARRRGLGT